MCYSAGYVSGDDWLRPISGLLAAEKDARHQSPSPDDNYAPVYGAVGQAFA